MKQLHRRQAGVTLIEMTVIAVLVSVLAALAVPRWLTYIPQLRTKAAVRDVVSTLRTARSLAISQKIPYGVFFDVDAGEYVLFCDTDSPGDNKYSVSDSVITSKPVGTDVGMGYTTFTDNAVVFDASGEASMSGTVLFSTGDYTRMFTVEVLAGTGKVKMVDGTSYIEVTTQ